MDLNLAVIAGTLAAPPEIRTFDSGTRLARYLVTVRSTEPRKRVDVVPVVEWDPPAEFDDETVDRGDRVWIAGTVQRRFWSGSEGRRSRLEIIAHYVQFPNSEAESEVDDS